MGLIPITRQKTVYCNAVRTRGTCLNFTASMQIYHMEVWEYFSISCTPHVIRGYLYSCDYVWHYNVIMNIIASDTLYVWIYGMTCSLCTHVM